MHMNNGEKVDHNQFLARIESEIDKFNEEELHILFHRVSERLKFFRAARQLTALSRFSIGDHVRFEYNGEVHEGHIVRLNRKTATVKTTAHGLWKVSPRFLERVARG
jgi:hypothetical protein